MSKKHKKAASVTTYNHPVSAFVPKKAKFVMHIGNVQVYGSSVFNLYQIPRLALRIDLSGMTAADTQLVTGNKAAKVLMPENLFPDNVPILSISWQDGTAHSLEREWWETLIEAIRALPDDTSVGVCCVGGTGRTGTVLSILAGLSGQLGPDETDPVNWLRDHYYPDAVETEAQMWYIEDVTGLLTNAFPSDYLYRPTAYPTGSQVTGTQVVSPPQGVVTGPLEASSFVGACDHTGS